MSRFWKHFIRSGPSNDHRTGTSHRWHEEPTLGLLLHPVRLPPRLGLLHEGLASTALEIIGMASICPATEAGLEEGDLLIGLGDESITSLADLQRALRRIRRGIPTTIRFLRGRRHLERLIIPTDSPDPATLREPEW